MNNEEDDKPTVVLDLNALKKELAENAKVSDEVTQDIEFAVHQDTDTHKLDELSLDESLDEEIDLSEEQHQRVVFFDFQSQYFSKLLPKLPEGHFNYEIISELKDLNAILQSKEAVTVVFNYNAAPKAVNQLTAQIKAKFAVTKTVIVAKGLSAEKAELHRKSKSGANAYLSVPFSIEKFEETIKKAK